MPNPLRTSARRLCHCARCSGLMNSPTRAVTASETFHPHRRRSDIGRATCDMKIDDKPSRHVMCTMGAIVFMRVHTARFDPILVDQQSLRSSLRLDNAPATESLAAVPRPPSESPLQAPRSVGVATNVQFCCEGHPRLHRSATDGFPLQVLLRSGTRLWVV